jgi:hypothetical protein
MSDALFSELHHAQAGPGSRAAGAWTRRGFIALFTLLMAIAVLGVFGQETTSSTATAAGATLRLNAPEHVRGGLFFQSRVEVRATSRIQYPRLVLDEGWVEGMQMNSIEPSPQSEASRQGRLVLSYDTLEPGDVLKVWLQFEVDPTYPGKRAYGIEIDDQATRLARVDRDLRVWP